MVSEAQKKASKKWNSNHKGKTKIYGYRSKARLFIRDYATAEDIKELQGLLDTRKKELRKDNE